MDNGLLIRVDASAAIGVGHAMRCLALAQAWREIGNDAVVFGTVGMPSSVTERIRREGFTVHQLSQPSDAEEIGQVADRISARHVVLDGYELDDELELALV